MTGRTINPHYSNKSFLVEIPNSGSTSTDLPGRRFAIVDPTQEPKNGWYVLVRLAPDEAPTVRILNIDGGEMHFQPLNPEYSIATPPSPEILGHVVEIQTFDKEPE